MSTTRRSFLSATLAGLAACGTPPPRTPLRKDTGGDTGSPTAVGRRGAALGAPPSETLSGALLRAEPGRASVYAWLDMYAKDGVPVSAARRSERSASIDAELGSYGDPLFPLERT